MERLRLFDIKAIKSFDWRLLKKYVTLKAADDLNIFLENLPLHAGNTILVVAAVAWGSAGALGLYTTVQLQSLTELRAELQEVEALQPMVPTIENVAIGGKVIEDFVDKVAKTYNGLTIKASGSTIILTAKSTSSFGQFREAVGHVQNGGSGWRVSVDRLCVGRECGREPLAASLKINKVSVQKPG